MDYNDIPDLMTIFKQSCCPPIHVIPRLVSNLAFYPPKPKLYDFVYDKKYNKSVLELNEEAIVYSQEILNKNLSIFLKQLYRFDVLMVDSRRGNRISCIFLRSPTTTNKTILYSHSNACDLGFICCHVWLISRQLNCNIMAYDYSGYGLSDGKPSENNLYADIDSALSALIYLYKISPKNIVLYGTSVGTVPTIDLSTRLVFYGVILESSIMSGLRTLCPKWIKQFWTIDPFPNLLKANKIKCKVLVIHGTNDELTDIKDAVILYKRCPQSVPPFWALGYRHNDVSSHPQYFQRIHLFITQLK
ncbi:alpha/beta hydrolase domain-containing protein 17C-like [Oppia nitens]|uniref:alpha/beta hydrolase domain-containing protein 17C-like n=1 Tax=Oppia nitens TaxID=1686743 RepID=UPI0023DBB941|nr:alpha/beta hydrolase domain-containing protein 17C-like [Oppia nitens]